MTGVVCSFCWVPNFTTQNGSLLPLGSLARRSTPFITVTTNVPTLSRKVCISNMWEGGVEGDEEEGRRRRGGGGGEEEEGRRRRGGGGGGAEEEGRRRGGGGGGEEEREGGEQGSEVSKGGR